MKAIYNVAVFADGAIKLTVQGGANINFENPNPAKCFNEKRIEEYNRRRGRRRERRSRK